MLKYAEAKVVFAEIPGEITLAINITNCPCHCMGCHSPWLWEDTGNPLTVDSLTHLLTRHNGITCVAFMGGDSTPSEIVDLARFVKKNYKHLKVAWYSGRDSIASEVKSALSCFDFVKIGHYDFHLGGLSSPNTNQRMYKVESKVVPEGGMSVMSRPLLVCTDITHKFRDIV